MFRGTRSVLRGGWCKTICCRHLHNVESIFGASNQGAAKVQKWEIIKPGNVGPLRKVPESIPRPWYVPSSGRYAQWKESQPLSEPEIKSPQQIQGMREACARARDILMESGEAVKPGVTTDYIDRVAHEACIKAGGYPSCLEYKDFPKSVCTSANNVVCHGIPDDRALQEGDIINIDFTIFYKGFHGDTSATFSVGEVDDAAKKLIDASKLCRDTAVSICGPGQPFSVIGESVQKLAEEHNLAVIPFFCGHGIGEYFHGPPSIVHIVNKEPGTMQPGMTFTVEPILSEGGILIWIEDDGWTALSLDDSRSAQFEHTILITDHGADILT